MNEPLSNHEINYLMRCVPEFRGTFMRDEQLPKSGSYVLNLDTSENLGTHWVAVYGNEYYDAFGLPPIEKLQHLDYNMVQHQKKDSSLCGYYACFYIWCRWSGISKFELCYNILKPNTDNKRCLTNWIKTIQIL